MLITPVVWKSVTGHKYNGVKGVGKGNADEINKFNKVQFYCTYLKDQEISFNRFQVVNLKITKCFFPHIVAWQLTPYGVTMPC